MGKIILRATDDVFDKFWAYVLAVKTEIGGFGFATIEHGRLVWHDIFLVDQDVSEGGVDFTDKGITQAIEHASQKKFFEDPNGVWVWWHSHCHHDVYWSGTDEGGVKALKESGIPYMISVVGNHKMKSKCRIDVFSVPIIGQAEHHDMELQRFEFETPDVKEEIAEFVREKKFPKWGRTSTTSTGWHGGQKQLPAGTRTSDPGDKLDQALVDRALGYAEYSQEELEGKSSVEEALGSGMDTDDNDLLFNWKDVTDFLGEDEAEAKEWEKAGCDVVCVNGAYFLLRWEGEHDESGNPDFNAMDKLVSRSDGEDSRPPIYEAHAS